MNYFVVFFTDFLPWLLGIGVVYFIVAVCGMKRESFDVFCSIAVGLVIAFLGGFVAQFLSPLALYYDEDIPPFRVFVIIVFVGTLAYYRYSDVKKEKQLAISSAEQVEQVMEFVEDVSHYILECSRQMYIFYDPDRKRVMVTLRVFDGKSTKDHYEQMRCGANFTNAMEDALEASLYDSPYQSKSLVLYGALHKMQIEQGEDLIYKRELMHCSSPQIMRILIKEMKQRFPEFVMTVSKYRNEWSAHVFFNKCDRQ